MKIPKETLHRFFIGGVCGVAGMLLCALLMECLAAGVRGVFHVPVLVGHGAQERFGSYGLAVLVQSVLMFALGGMAGIATLPFAEDGKTLVKHSVLHFAVTALLFSLLMVLCFDLLSGLLPGWLLCLLAVYLVIWLGRYVGWYAELLELRDQLGLVPPPSPLKWRQTLPYIPFLLVLCLGLPFLARLCDPRDFPVVSGLLHPYLLLPVGSFAAGFSLGKRQGMCPLYPVFAFVLCIPAVFLLYNSSAMFHCFIAAGASLFGTLLGALKRRMSWK